MLIRTYADIEKLEGNASLSAAEEALIENFRIGQPTVLGDGSLPEGPSPERTIRASLLRYLILGGCDACKPYGRGVILHGAWIRDSLDLRFEQAKGSVVLGRCYFEKAVAANQAHFEFLQLDDSSLPELDAEGVIVKGDVFIRRLISNGEVLFTGAEIGGQLSCTGARLNCQEGEALNAEGAMIRGGVFLRELKSHGVVSFAAAEIGGQFSCKDAELTGVNGVALNLHTAAVKGNVFLREMKSMGEVSFCGAKIDGQLLFIGAQLNGGKRDALSGQRMVVKGGLFLRGLNSVVGSVDLTAAQLGDLVDDEKSWSLCTDLRLVGLSYENLAGPLDLVFRKRWLIKGARFGGDFHPQPYQQLAKFYRETGHRYEAREILVAKEIQQRKAAREAIRNGKSRTDSYFAPHVLIAFHRIWDRTTRLIAGYGYKPWLSLWWLGGMVAIIMIAAQATWNAGDFAPNSAVVLTSSDWKSIADGPSGNPAADWTASNAPGKDYETFYAFAYALDVVVPVLDLGQTDAWAPSPARGDWGYRMFYLQKMFIVLGWVVTAIAAAAISGMIRRDD